MIIKEIEEKTYKEFYDFIEFTLNTFINQQNKEHEHTLNILKEIKIRVEFYDKNIIIL